MEFGDQNMIGGLLREKRHLTFGTLSMCSLHVLCTVRVKQIINTNDNKINIQISLMGWFKLNWWHHNNMREIKKEGLPVRRGVADGTRLMCLYLINLLRWIGTDWWKWSTCIVRKSVLEKKHLGRVIKRIRRDLIRINKVKLIHLCHRRQVINQI